MRRAMKAPRSATLRTHLRLYQAPASGANTNRWRINGHGATITIWTAEEWENLEERPADAQYYPCGIWCALRVD
jgi:hypothetical protein